MTSSGRRQVAAAGLVPELGDPGAARIAVVDHDGRRSRGRPGAGVDTPPTSQRSQMVNSGSMPIAACSAACSAPGHAAGATPARASRPRAPRTRTPACTASNGGRSSAVVAEASRRSGVLTLVAGDLLVHLDGAEAHVELPHAGASASRRTIRMSMSVRATVYVAPSSGSTMAVRPVEVEGGRPARPGPRAGRTAPGCTCSQARASSTVPTACRRSCGCCTSPPAPTAQTRRRGPATRHPHRAPAAPAAYLLAHDAPRPHEPAQDDLVEEAGPVALVGMGERHLVGGAAADGRRRRTGWRG